MGGRCGTRREKSGGAEQDRHVGVVPATVGETRRFGDVALLAGGGRLLHAQGIHVGPEEQPLLETAGRFVVGPQSGHAWETPHWEGQSFEVGGHGLRRPVFLEGCFRAAVEVAPELHDLIGVAAGEGENVHRTTACPPRGLESRGEGPRMRGLGNRSAREDHVSKSGLVLSALLLCAARITAQGGPPSFEDLIRVRNRRFAKDSFLEVSGGLLGNLGSGTDQTRLREDLYGLDGHVYYRQAQAFGRRGRLDAYVGRDGAYAGLTEGDPKTDKGYSRIELYGRFWGAFEREGFYDGNDFVTTGSYRRRDWRARLSFATTVARGLRGEVGAFYGRNDFDAYSRTPANFKVPGSYKVYGFSLVAEDNKIEIDPQTLLPFRGSLLTLWAEREWNDSSDTFGPLGNRTSLPSTVIRGGGHLEWYFPYSNTGTWILTADGGLTASDDRIRIYDAGKPIGRLYADLRIDYRILLSDLITLRPGGRLQWIRIDDEFGTTTQSKIFWGVQAELRFDFSESLALRIDYSFLTNESREPVNLGRDVIGGHRFFVGVEFRP